MTPEALLAAAGGLRRSYEDVDWSATPLGPVEGWSLTLRNAVDFVLQTQFPVTLFWGPEFVLVYNEAYAFFRMGYASALAWFLLFLIACFTAFSFLTSKFWVHYDD